MRLNFIATDQRTNRETQRNALKHLILSMYATDLVIYSLSWRNDFICLYWVLIPRGLFYLSLFQQKIQEQREHERLLI